MSREGQEFGKLFKRQAVLDLLFLMVTLKWLDVQDSYAV